MQKLIMKNRGWIMDWVKICVGGADPKIRITNDRV